MIALPDAHPLQWPLGWKRTANWDRPRSKYKVSEGRARDELYESIRLLGGDGTIISSNLRLTRGGRPYTNQPLPQDSGVAVYWARKGKQEVMACDKWMHPWENMRAIYHAIEGLRSMERAGATQIMERAFQAFQLPTGEGPSWRAVLKIEPHLTPTVDFVKRIARDRLRAYHPDNKATGDEEEYKAVERAQREALQELA